MSTLRFWSWLTWLEFPLMTRRRAEGQAQAAFRLGVDAGATGLVQPSPEPSPVRHLPGMLSRVVGVEIPQGTSR